MRFRFAWPDEGRLPQSTVAVQRVIAYLLKRQQEGKSMYAPARVEMVIGMLSSAHPDQPTDMWELLRKTVDEGCKSIDQRLHQYGRWNQNVSACKKPTNGWQSWWNEGGSAREIQDRSDLRER